MCGILGGIQQEWDYEASLKALRHRGPDTQKIVNLKDFNLGFSRLAIIDLSPNANQPMASADNQVYIVFNGEIYAYQALRKELENKGYQFKTQSDTEVLLNAYLHWNDNFVNHIDGMFAIAIYDNRIKKIKLFRDHAGIKPLYYLYDNDLFAFASELKGLTALCCNYNFKIDNSAIYDYLTYLYIPDPKTLYKNVYKLKAAHQLTYDLHSKRIDQIKPYWELKAYPSPKPIAVEAAVEQLKDLISQSVKNQIIADVPVGFFLSGGLDSSVVVAEGAKYSKNLNTFSIGFDDPRKSELGFAQQVANRFGTRHRTKILSSSENQKLIHNLKDWYDEPFADTSAFPTYLVCEFAKQFVTVVLSGDGGDELFGGYKRYTYYRNLKPLQSLSFLKNSSVAKWIADCKSKHPYKSFNYRFLNLLSHFCGDHFVLYTKLMGGMTHFEKTKYANILKIPKDYDDYWFFRQYYKKELPVVTALQYMDFHTYLPCDILTKVDRVSMAVSLEIRVPLLSKSIIEFAFSLPEDIRLWNSQLKGIVKNAYQGILPADIIKRGKMGFGVPLSYLKSNNEMPHVNYLKDVFGINIEELA